MEEVVAMVENYVAQGREVGYYYRSSKFIPPLSSSSLFKLMRDNEEDVWEKSKFEAGGSKYNNFGGQKLGH
jgi:hypothetical protein